MKHNKSYRVFLGLLSHKRKEIHASASAQFEENNLLFSMLLTYSDPQKIKAILDAI